MSARAAVVETDSLQETGPVRPVPGGPHRFETQQGGSGEAAVPAGPGPAHREYLLRGTQPIDHSSLVILEASPLDRQFAVPQAVDTPALTDDDDFDIRHQASEPFEGEMSATCEPASGPRALAAYCHEPTGEDCRPLPRWRQMLHPGHAPGVCRLP